VLAINAASAAVMISDIPWNGPVGAVRIGLVNREFVVNPTFEKWKSSALDLRMAGTRDAILMVECGARSPRRRHGRRPRFWATKPCSP
jgi:polyribonucleotide nucleotidyltransferase